MKNVMLACVLSALSPLASAALYDRGNGMIYDDVLDITWLQDANYASTSGYAAANANGAQHSSSGNIQADGAMGWLAANNWAGQLVYGGYDDWRLASAGSNPSTGYNITTSELGHMFYNNLGLTAGDDILDNVSFNDGNTNVLTSFVNVQSNAYWFAEQNAGDTDYAWSFYANAGGNFIDIKWASFYGWAVRDGDVAVVPLPAAAWLFGASLISLLSFTRGKKSADRSA